MSDLKIRDARKRERPAIVALTLAAYQEYAAAIPDHWPHYSENIVSTLSRPAPGRLIVAERAGEVLGSVLLYHAGDVRRRDDGTTFTMSEPEFRLLAVHPAARGHGVGPALVRECIDRAQAAGAPTLTLHSTEIMRTALAMYQRMGFVRAPELDFEVEDAPYLIEGYRLSLRDRE